MTLINKCSTCHKFLNIYCKDMQIISVNYTQNKETTFNLSCFVHLQFLFYSIVSFLISLILLLNYFSFCQRCLFCMSLLHLPPVLSSFSVSCYPADFCFLSASFPPPVLLIRIIFAVFIYLFLFQMILSFLYRLLSFR